MTTADLWVLFIIKTFFREKICRFFRNLQNKWSFYPEGEAKQKFINKTMCENISLKNYPICGFVISDAKCCTGHQPKWFFAKCLLIDSFSSTWCSSFSRIVTLPANIMEDTLPSEMPKACTWHPLVQELFSKPDQTVCPRMNYFPLKTLLHKPVLLLHLTHVTFQWNKVTKLLLMRTMLDWLNYGILMVLIRQLIKSRLSCS